MKKIISFGFVFAMILGFSAISFGQTAETAEVKDGPVIKLDKEVHDYGTIDQGANGECKFIVTNEGNQPLVISLCKGSCGCTVPVCPKEPIAPGESKEITVKYNTNRVGPINKSVNISSNAVNAVGGKTKVTIKGNVKAKPSGGAPVNTGLPTND
ncbi:MAG: DUF1573 domain-containing protein [Flavobacteriales bacterium]|nr:DUF1573 domain-containing protein [Flavobacteriales bacterium]